MISMQFKGGAWGFEYYAYGHDDFWYLNDYFKSDGTINPMFRIDGICIACGILSKFFEVKGIKTEWIPNYLISIHKHFGVTVEDDEHGFHRAGWLEGWLSAHEVNDDNRNEMWAKAMEAWKNYKGVDKI